MIVAAGAGQRNPGEHAANGVGDVVQDLLSALAQITGVVFVRVMAVEGSRNPRVGTLGPKLVTSELLADESIIRLVRIEGLDHIVAGAPDIRARFVLLEPFALGVAGE